MRSPAAQVSVERLGYCMTDGIAPAITAAALDIATDLLDTRAGGFHTSAIDPDRDYQRRINETIGPLFADVIEELFDDHIVLHTAILAKFPDPDSAMAGHQDWTMVDETRFRSLNLWCPLSDVSPANGALEIVPGSHRVLTAPRGSPHHPPTFANPIAGLADDAFHTLPLTVGQALVTDHGLVHRSAPNGSDELRIAIALGVAPREAQILHFFWHPDHRLERFRVPDPTWFRQAEMGRRPTGAESDGFVRCGGPTLDSAALAECSRAAASTGAPSRPWWRRLRGEDPAAAWPSVPPLEVVAGPDPVEPTRRLLPDPSDVPATFRDPRLQEQFARDGVVVVDLVDPELVAELRGAYDRLENPADVDGPLAEGFHTTIYDGRRSYRAEVFDLIRSTVEAGLDELLVDHHVFLANFFAKRPGAAAIAPHVDWTFVDEQAHSSVTVWLPLEATDLHNGTLGVALGSHRNVDFIRAVNYRDNDLHAAMSAGDDRSVSYSLSTGQAVLMDSRLLHFSASNNSDRLRLAAACVAAPRSAPLFHYWLDDAQTLHRLELDPEFYLQYRIGTDPRPADGVLEVRAAGPLTYG